MVEFWFYVTTCGRLIPIYRWEVAGVERAFGLDFGPRTACITVEAGNG